MNVIKVREFRRCACCFIKKKKKYYGINCCADGCHTGRIHPRNRTLMLFPWQFDQIMGPPLHILDYAIHRLPKNVTSGINVSCVVGKNDVFNPFLPEGV